MERPASQIVNGIAGSERFFGGDAVEGKRILRRAVQNAAHSPRNGIGLADCYGRDGRFRLRDFFFFGLPPFAPQRESWSLPYFLAVLAPPFAAMQRGHTSLVSG